MFKILDLYIIRKFLTTFFFMLGIIMLLSMVFDLSERLGEFLINKAPIYDIITVYYFNFILLYGNSFSFMIVFIAVIWFTAKMAQDTEIIPIWNSGKPFSRFIRPYMLAATVLVIISLFINHLILPFSNKKSLEFQEKYYMVPLSVNNYLADFPSNQTVQFSSYVADANVVEHFVLERFNDDNTLAYLLVARKAQNELGTNRWELKDYYERYLSYPKDSIFEGARKDTIFDFTIAEMATRDELASSMKTKELKEFIEREKAKGSGKIPMYQLEMYQRTANPFATYVLTIIGIAVSSRKKRGGIGANIAIGLVVVLIYIFAMKIMAVSAENVGVPATIAAWVPNILFAFVAMIMYRFVQK